MERAIDFWYEVCIHYAPFRFIRKDYLESETAEAVEALCRRLQQNKHQITLDTSDGTIMKLNLSEIVCFFAMQHSIFLYNADKETIELAHRTYTMEKLEELTAPYGFMRTHKAWLLGPRFIYQIGTDTITLVSEVSKNEHDEIPMSRRRAAQMHWKPLCCIPACLWSCGSLPLYLPSPSCFCGAVRASSSL
ncbi:MAG: LytTR family transcriptional regulator [Oscillospiraceae bacterium]|nr:LytTR family transcriptional regulator [Oscillospiraceae bacterium]